MSKKRISTEQLKDISVKMVKALADELYDEEYTLNPADMVCVLGIMHRTLFANIEAKDGIEKASEATGFLVDLVQITMKDGAWDEENKCMK